MNIIIVAGGFNTRFEEFSIFPKILLPYKNNDSILINNLKFFNQEKNNIYMIINKKYYGMVNDYIESNNLFVNLICLSKDTTGSYETIRSCLDKLPSSDLLFVWSDLVFTKKLKLGKQKGIIVYTDNDGSYRFRAEGNKIRKVARENLSNVPGIYFVENSHILKNGPNIKGFDLVEHLSGMKIKVKKIEQEIIEFRDKETYLDFLDKEKEEMIVPRKFNNITIKRNKFIKEQKNKNLNLLANEVNWYKLSDDRFHPKLLEFSEFKYITRFLKGYETLHNYVSRTGNYSIVDVVLEKLEDLHGKKTYFKEHIVNYDIRHELYGKVLDRTEKVKNMIIKYNYTKLEKILRKALDYILKNVDNENYNFIHGDPNGSNVMINNKTLDIKFVDPRGYFGCTDIYGIPEYDYAKINYFLNGYDHFNIGKYLYSSNGYDKPKILYKHPKLDTKLYRIMVGIIYIALTSYISNNIFKVNIAYEHGLEILKGEFE